MTKLSLPEKYRGLRIRIKEEGTKPALTKKNRQYSYIEIREKCIRLLPCSKIAADN